VKPCRSGLLTSKRLSSRCAARSSWRSRNADDRVQAERALAAAEIDQLKAMITQLRQELEAQERDTADRLQQQRRQAAD
jgi:hypothetical protein